MSFRGCSQVMSSLKGEGGVDQKMTCDDMMTQGGGLMTKYPLFTEIVVKHLLF